MYNLFFLLICVILAILFGKMINVDMPVRPPRPLAQTGGYIERGNFTYFYVHHRGPVILNLTSLLGDADLYISDNNMYPTFDPEIYALHSATCGEDIIELPENFESPLAVAVYGHAEFSDFLLEIYENPQIAYPYKQWATIDLEIENFKNGKVQENKNIEIHNDDNKKITNTQTLKKKKKSKGGSNIPGVFSVLEILQLIFL